MYLNYTLIETPLFLPSTYQLKVQWTLTNPKSLGPEVFRLVNMYSLNGERFNFHFKNSYEYHSIGLSD